MDTINSLLERIKERRDGVSDRQIARRLAVTPQLVSAWRLGLRYPDDDVCVLIADELELAPAYVLICIRAENAKTERLAREWESLLAVLTKGVKAASLAAAATLAGLLSVASPGEAEARTTPTVNQGATIYTLCAFSVSRIPPPPGPLSTPGADCSGSHGSSRCSR